MLLQGRQVDGLIVIPVFQDKENLLMYQKLQIPYIFAGRRVDGIQDHSILHNDIRGSEDVIEYLLANGHKKYFTFPDQKILATLWTGLKDLYKLIAIPVWKLIRIY